MELNKGILHLTARGQNNPILDNDGEVNPVSKGYGADLDHIVKSSREANYCRILKYLDIDFGYETESFAINECCYTYVSNFKMSDTHFI
ncbi:MAG: hypothetical protein R2685_04985 [Candidatus Nitrosocosmicus sp.]|nr:hypothetical protein [Candidatus Nitrosocosmicus sp.]